MTEDLQAQIKKTMKNAFDEGYMFWAFMVDEKSCEIFANQPWNKNQICAATVEAIQNISPDFVKEA